MRRIRRVKGGKNEVKKKRGSNDSGWLYLGRTFVMMVGGDDDDNKTPTN